MNGLLGAPQIDSLRRTMQNAGCAQYHLQSEPNTIQITRHAAKWENPTPGQEKSGPAAQHQEQDAGRAQSRSQH